MNDLDLLPALALLGGSATVQVLARLVPNGERVVREDMIREAARRLGLGTDYADRVFLPRCEW